MNVSRLLLHILRIQRRRSAIPNVSTFTLRANQAVFLQLFHEQCQHRSSLAVRHSDSLEMATSFSTTETTSVAYRCLRSCVCQQYNFTDTGLVTPGNSLSTSQSSKFIDVFAKQHEIKTSSGTKYVYRVFTGINGHLEESQETASDSTIPKDSLNRSSIDFRTRSPKENRHYEKLDSSIALIPSAPWIHEEITELCYLAALRFSFPSSYFSLISSIPALDPLDEKGQLRENSAVDVYSPVVRYFLESEKTAVDALEKLLRRLAYFTTDSKVISTKQVSHYELSLAITVDKPVDASISSIDRSVYDHCIERAKIDAEEKPIAEVGGLSVEVKEKIASPVSKSKNEGHREVILRTTTTCPSASWFFLYAEAIRLIEPTVISVFEKMLGKNCMRTYDKQKIAAILNSIFGRKAASQIGISEKPEVSQKYFCSADIIVSNGTSESSILLHHVTGTSNHEVLFKMRCFLKSYYINRVGVYHSLPSNNLYVSERFHKSISEKLDRDAPLAAKSEKKEKLEDNIELQILLKCVQETGEDVSFSKEDDATLNTSLLGKGHSPIQAVLLSSKHKSKHSPKASCFIGGDYHSTARVCIAYFLKKFYPNFHAKYTRLWSIQRDGQSKKKKDHYSQSLLAREYANLQPLVLTREAHASEASILKFSIQPVGANDDDHRVIYDPVSVLRGNCNADGTNFPKPAIRAFIDVHSRFFNTKEEELNEDTIRPINCLDSLHPLVSRLMKALLSPDVKIRTFICQRSDRVPISDSNVELFYKKSSKTAIDGLFSGFAWFEVNENEAASESVGAVNSALERFLHLETKNEPSFLSLIAAVYNMNCHDQCVAHLDASILRNVFPEIYIWLQKISKTCNSFPILPGDPGLSFYPESGDQCRLNLLRKSVAEYFGCERLREVCVRQGCLFEIHLLHPVTNAHTGLSFVRSSSPVVGLLRVYQDALFSDNHNERFADFRKAFIARDAVLTKGNTHRTARSLMQFVSTHLHRELGLSLNISSEVDKKHGVTCFKAFGSNQKGHSIELISINISQKTKRHNLNGVLLTLCHLYVPDAMRSAMQLVPNDARSFGNCGSHLLPYLAYSTETDRSDSQRVLPESLHTCIFDQMIGSLQASTDGNEFFSLFVRGSVHDELYTISIHLKNSAETMITSHSSESPLFSAQHCGELLFTNKQDSQSTWFFGKKSEPVSGGKDIILKLTHPFSSKDLRITLPALKPGFDYLVRLLRHCCLSFFGLELQVTEEDTNGYQTLTVFAHGKYRKKINLCQASSRKIYHEKVIAEKIALHFPKVLESINSEVKLKIFPPGTELPGKEVSKGKNALVYSAIPKMCFSLPHTDTKCTLQLMRMAFEKTFNFTPRESVRVLNHNEKLVWVEILDEKKTVVEHHKSRSLPFSLMECYGNILQRNKLAMSAFEHMERSHRYSPSPSLRLDDPAGEGVFNLLIYVVKYELGLETMCSRQSSEGGTVRAVLSAVSPNRLHAVNVGEELLLSVGWDTSECTARRYASIIALKTHFPIYYRKHELSIGNGKPLIRKLLPSQSKCSGKEQHKE